MIARPGGLRRELLRAQVSQPVPIPDLTRIVEVRHGGVIGRVLRIAEQPLPLVSTALDQLERHGLLLHAREAVRHCEA